MVHRGSQKFNTLITSCISQNISIYMQILFLRDAARTAANSRTNLSTANIPIGSEVAPPSVFHGHILRLLHLFPLLCGVDVSCETPPSRPVMRVLPWQPPLRQVVPDAIQPPPVWYSSPSFPRHLHPHHSLAYVVIIRLLFSNMPIPLQPTLLHFLGYFSHFRVPLIISFLILSIILSKRCR